MNLRDLIDAILSDNDLIARQWVKDFKRSGIKLNSFPFPNDFNEIELSLAAGLLELFSERFNQSPPDWTSKVGGINNQIAISKSIYRLGKLKELCESKGPLPLLKRNILAFPDYLNVL